MEPPQQNAPAATTLPPARRLLLFALLLPAFVAGANHLLINTLSGDSAKLWLFPALIASTAAMSWCAGRYLYPLWFRSILFAWCLVLLDGLVSMVCMSRRLDDPYGYVLVSAQVCLLVLWAVLGAQPWQWRLPAVAALLLIVIVFSGSLLSSFRSSKGHTWNAMMIFAAAIIALVCGGLRYSGFTLQDLSRSTGEASHAHRPFYQFGMKHMLIWFTVSGPLLLFVRSLDLKGTTVFPAALLAFSIATVNLLAIWSVLGSGYWLVRVAALIGIPFLIAFGMSRYSVHLKATISIQGSIWQHDYYGTIQGVIIQMQNHWIAWLWIDAALLAALLLFFRASGYRLTRSLL
jgi:hypothetical protein